MKREYGQHVTFAGGISTQRTLPFGTPEELRRDVRERIQVLGQDGGYLCGLNHTIRPEVPVRNIVALFDEIRNFCVDGVTCGAATQAHDLDLC